MTTTQNLARPWGLLEPDAWKAGTSGSEGAGAQQCAPATRRFHIRWQRKRGSNQWHVYTLVADRPFRAVKARVRALTRRTSQQPLGATLERINGILRGWTNYFRHAVAKRTFAQLHHFVWWRIVRWQCTRHRWGWKDVRRWLTTVTGRWRPIGADGITLFDASAVAVRRYRYRGRTGIPSPWAAAART